MPIYIVTEWTHSDEGEADEWFGRRVVRGWANDEADFLAHIRSEDANDEIAFGPVSLSKDQSWR